MFYEGIGTLLTRAADALDSTGVAATDDSTQRQVRMVTTLVRRFGTIMPDLFAALEEELELLDDTRQRARVHLQSLGAMTDDGESSQPGVHDRDPLVRLRAVVAEIDDAAVTLHRLDAGDPAVRAARADLRRGLAAAAAVEGRLVDAMLEL